MFGARGPLRNAVEMSLPVFPAPLGLPSRKNVVGDDAARSGDVLIGGLVRPDQYPYARLAHCSEQLSPPAHPSLSQNTPRSARATHALPPAQDDGICDISSFVLINPTCYAPLQTHSTNQAGPSTMLAQSQ